MSGVRWRIALAILVLLAGIVYILPSILGVNNSPLASILPKSKINLGLDLKGGIHLTLGVEVQKAVANALAQTGQDLRAEAQEKGITILRPRVIGTDTLEFILPKPEQEKSLRELLGKRFEHLNADKAASAEGGQLRYTARFTEAYLRNLEDMALDQALRTIRNRIDQFGVAEPDIRKQAGHRIQVQLPGVSDTQRAIQLIGQTAHLEFHIVREDVDPGRAVPPPGVVILPLIEKSANAKDEQAEKYLAVDKDAILTGEDVSDARPGFDQMNQSYVTLSFNNRGAAVFERITAENVGKRLAIVLDGKIYSAPSIRERISGGRASITGNFSTAEAHDLAIVLRAGSLPAPVSVLEERTVGPSLGQESIDNGLKASVVGALGVIIFMGVYYGISGIIANMMLAFTILLLMAGMAAFGATLTMPGIAGIVLTIGMSVDANVLIYERIREELRRGLTPLAAVNTGFERAAIAITDSNLTTIIATAILYQFGTGPVRGFAVTLSLGIIASMFTAIFVSRAIFEAWARRGKGISV